MFEKLEAVEKRYEELTKIISDPEVIANQTEWQKAMKEHASMEEIVLKFREYKKIKQSMEEAEELMQDPDMKELAEEEYYASKEKLPKLEEELKFLLIPLLKVILKLYHTLSAPSKLGLLNSEYVLFKFFISLLILIVQTYDIFLTYASL